MKLLQKAASPGGKSHYTGDWLLGDTKENALVLKQDINNINAFFSLEIIGSHAAGDKIILEMSESLRG